jgi:hypothetical protein
MPVLHIDIQEGFDQDAVIILVNDQSVFHKESVSTRMQIGLADRVQTEVPLGAVTVKVSLPRKRLSTSIPVNIDGETYMGISVEENSITCQINTSPFRYA